MTEEEAWAKLRLLVDKAPRDPTAEEIAVHAARISVIVGCVNGFSLTLAAMALGHILGLAARSKPIMDQAIEQETIAGLTSIMHELMKGQPKDS